MTNAEAWDVYTALLADDRVDFREQEPAGLERQWAADARRDNSSPKLWMDAYLAAFARTAGVQRVTTDGAFEQFPGLDVRILR